MTRDDLRKLQARLPLSAATIARNPPDDSRLRPDDAKPVEGHALVGPSPRTRKGRKGTVLGAPRRRFRFRFVIFSTRPADWDGYSVKEIQDCLVHAGLVDDDAWNLLSGEVISEKAHSKADERTEITIE